MMQNHELVVSSFIANGDVINATVSVRAMAVPMLNIFNMEVYIAQIEGGTIEYYESEAIKAAAKVISVLNDDINKAA
ncbi:DUF1327 domain-containing protein [Enterobacter hormaechei]|uniref:DUF1327 domain-containing protein n=1 Tax=Enterobacter hormaechei TaxID=158836 RepID=UPI00294A8ADC|nr:DUF1327 domain-containing protein [Enterobacter hormaechei]MDV5735364.1 DUF1327 domain-containing protein [Enterobacter hormaechei]MDV5802130.1 DUF1327 domain-containing protein [Enterobacter hormaechei]MDV5840577.1 DUF1327 domain-containing protein [Enterobacter hormaechei]